MLDHMTFRRESVPCLIKLNKKLRVICCETKYDFLSYDVFQHRKIVTTY